MAPSLEGSGLQDKFGGPFTHIDARLRILTVLAFSVVLVSLNRFEPVIISVLLALNALIQAELPLKQTLRRIIAMDGFVIATLVLLPFTVPGEPFYVLWGFPASWDGLTQAALIGLKANGVLMMLLALLGSMNPSTLAKGLSGLRCPPALVHLLLFTVRYVAVIGDEYKRLRRAMKTRCFHPRNSVHTYRSIGYLIGMLLIRALDRSERILGAMKCRGFTGQLPPGDQLRFKRQDWFFAALALWCIGGMIYLEVFPVVRLF